MILDLDLGNTRVKWRVVSADGVVARGQSGLESFPSAELLALSDIKRVRLAAVCSEDIVNRVKTVLQATWPVIVECAKVSAQAGAVINAYREPSSMGVDRWLIILAAHRKLLAAPSCGGCVVVSCGTACTLDFVHRDGQHHGGYILPGVYLMREALREKTARIRFDAGEIDWQRAPGSSTAAAVEHGAIHAILSAIEQAYTESQRRYGTSKLLLTGGDAAQLAALLAVHAEVDTELVLTGLELALPG